METSELDELKEDIAVGEMNQFETITLPLELVKRLVEQAETAVNTK
jgi:hypothetical protein